MAQRFCVYDLVDPRCGTTFYVGKATSAVSRLHSHLSEARNGRVSRKCERIREIEQNGKTVAQVVIAEFDVEDDAFEFERARISQIGIENLTNVCAGGAGGRYGSSARDAAIQLAARFEFIAKWMRKGQPSTFSFGGVQCDVSELIKKIRSEANALIRVAGKMKTEEVAERYGIRVNWVEQRRV